MQWVRMNSLITNWPGGGSPPSFEISADDNGSAVVELAWDPQALMHPASYTDPLRYYSTDVLFSANLTTSTGGNRSLNVPPQTIQLAGNRATWNMPDDLWNAYIEETLKTVGGALHTTFSRNLYYRVRVTPSGSAQAKVWPQDSALTGPGAENAPHIGILPMSATLSSQVIPDMPAVQAMSSSAVTRIVYSEMLMWFWRNLPETDPYRRSLVEVFAYFNETDGDIQDRLTTNTKAKILKLWLFAGPEARRKVPQLLRRRTVVGSNLTQAIISKTALVGGKTLVDQLLDLLSITPHPDLLGVTTNEQLLDDVITEILDPNGQINQGAAGTCSPTSIQTLLINVNPAEYARLQVGLLSASASVGLANGQTVRVPPTIFQAALYLPHTGGNAFFLRTNSELAFQAAMLRYGQDSRFPALNGTPQSNAAAFLQVINGGLTSDESKRVLDGVFGVNFTTHYIPVGALSDIQAAQQTILNDFLRDLPGRQQQMLLAVYWGAPYGQPSPPGGGHAVLALYRESGRVFFKNPQYRGSNPGGGVLAGGNGTNPPRRFEDPSQSKESVSETDLRSWIKGYWVPDTAII